MSNALFAVVYKANEMFIDNLPVDSIKYVDLVYPLIEFNIFSE